MQKAEIHVGRHYAFREKRLSGAPIQQIRILSHARGRKWKAEWINPNPGLVDYVDSNQLVTSWKERMVFLRNEESEQRFGLRFRSKTLSGGALAVDGLLLCAFRLSQAISQPAEDGGTIHRRTGGRNRIIE